MKITIPLNIQFEDLNAEAQLDLIHTINDSLLETRSDLVQEYILKLTGKKKEELTVADFEYFSSCLANDLAENFNVKIDFECDLNA